MQNNMCEAFLKYDRCVTDFVVKGSFNDWISTDSNSCNKFLSF